MTEMCKHEEKYCPRCEVLFECKVGSILLCQCTTVRLDEAERRYLSESFDDCLCANCMQALKLEYNAGLLEQETNNISR